ncbi:MAG: helix-turn-helix transcriptional regulator [Bdellovibrionales bacterium]|nr:helix-turn-helix transcriptional regulator [Bdellovibrionales bacterium]
MKGFKGLGEKNILQLIGESIKGSRIASNLTLIELADKSEISKTTLSRIENGKINTTILVLIRIFTALGREKEIQSLFPQPFESPILRSKQEKKTSGLPKRVRKTKKEKSDWFWGENNNE